MPEDPSIPNHHRDWPGFAGLIGLVAAASMTVGRDGDARTAATLVHLAAGDAVVDIGCGPGAAARHAARQGAAVVGVDPAPVMLRVARLLTRSRAVRYVEGSAEDLPLADGSATVAWSLATVHHWRDVDVGLREVHRVLRPGGRFVAIERASQPGATGLGSHGWTTDQADAFRRLCATHGFDELATERPVTTGRRPIVAVVARRP